MKNMKIGKKLFFGFAVPIALMALIVILVVTMNLLTIRSIQSIGRQTDLWDFAADARGNFLQARIQANVLTFSYSENTYNTTKDLIGSAQTNVSDAVDYISKTPELDSFKSDADEAASALSEYDKDLDAMNSALIASEDSAAKTTAAGSTLGGHLSNVMTGQIGSMETDFRTYHADPDGSIISARAEKLENLNKLYANIDAMRMSVREQLKLYDADGATAALSQADSVIAELDDFTAALTVPANILAANTLKEDLETYKADFEEFVNNKIAATDAKTAFVAAGNDATTALSNLADQNDAVNTNVSSAENTGYLSLAIVTGIVIAAIIISVIMAMSISRAITKPITYVTEILTAIGTRGRTEFSEEEWALQRQYASGKDETAEMSHMLGNVANALNGVAGLLGRIADGDLTITHTAMSDDDTLSHAIITTIDKLNFMFSEIHEASEQVSMGASQISDASQSLAEGSTEQAATVEELSASIEDVSQKTKANAERAVSAADLSTSIKDNAEKGSAQMSEMTKAVSEINQASQDISKVIKVIDDIAFQTNILALNAAVEAARAGEAGKGFAVVADEVRNLASKSAAAAKETGVLIENSMRKAELGSAIAEQTAASLTDIVEGINKSTDLINDIANSSEEQSMAISQINEGISQVSEVVQKNSATAEECAASAEELNAQSALLQNHISQFHLKSV